MSAITFFCPLFSPCEQNKASFFSIHMSLCEPLNVATSKENKTNNTISKAFKNRKEWSTFLLMQVLTWPSLFSQRLFAIAFQMFVKFSNVMFFLERKASASRWPVTRTKI